MDKSPFRLLLKLTSSLEQASRALPLDESTKPDPNGVSLLDVKNELLVSYLQNVVFLVIFRLRNRDHDEPLQFSNEVIRGLVELRLYFDKGVRPLETRTKHQLEKIVRAADVAEKEALRIASGQQKKEINNEEDRQDTGSEEEEEEEEDGRAYQPNLAAFVKPFRSHEESGQRDYSVSDGIYRPPRTTPTALPKQSNFDDRKGRTARKLLRSHTIDDFINAEVSHAPIAEPSIGSTIVAGGRHTKSERERRDEYERTMYEENNFVRLPPQSKKERAKYAGRRQGGFGGEEARGLGEGLDRIDRLTSKKRSCEREGDGRSRQEIDDRDAKRRKNERT